MHSTALPTLDIYLTYANCYIHATRASEQGSSFTPIKSSAIPRYRHFPLTILLQVSHPVLQDTVPRNASSATSNRPELRSLRRL